MTLHPLLESYWINAILPELILAGAGMVLILLEAFLPRMRGAFAPLAIVVFIAAGYSEFLIHEGTFFGGTYQVSGISRLFDFAFLLAALLASMFAREYLVQQNIDGGEFYALLMWGTVGMMMMAKGLDLLIIILGLETLSVCIFVLVGFNRRLPVSNEASLKYFLMGAFATGFILYGTALFYGAAGSTNLREMTNYFAAVDGASNPLLTVAFIMLMAGLGFKLALAPFHGWAPDVYQGAPTPVAAWLSVAPKIATIVALFRIFGAMYPVAHQLHWMQIVAVLSVLSMVLGNFVAIAQRDLKRMLAYSGIAHVGYMMVAVRVGREDSVAAILTYGLTYALMNIGAFGVVSLIQKNQNDPQTLDDIAGLGWRRPFYGAALAVFMFSLAGLPPTAGFISKFYVFKVAIDAGDVKLAIIGILTSIVSTYYYLRVVYYLYMKDADELTPLTSDGPFATGALIIAVIGIFLIGLHPAPLFQSALDAAGALFHTH